jgi:hypothetical protein
MCLYITVAIIPGKASYILIIYDWLVAVVQALM